MFEGLKEKVSNIQIPPELRQFAEMFMSTLGATTKKTVAVSFSQNIGLEMLELDNITGIVTKYNVKPLVYDTTNRKIGNYDDFANCISDLFEEFEISANSNVVLSLPNIYFGLLDVPSVLRGDAVRNVILSEVEQSYIFKTNEPLVSWCNLSKGKRDKNKPNTVAYSAIQKDVIDGILDACQGIGCRFLTIENSNLSILRGLSFLGYSKDQIRDNSVWQLLIVSATNFSITSLKGETPISYFEEPLAMKSFEEDEIYRAISASAKDVINSTKIQSTNLMIVSETDFVSAEILKNNLETQVPIEFLECNKYSNQVLYPVSYEITPELSEQMTISAIGTAAFVFHKFPISLNFIKENVEELQQIDDQIGNIKVNLGNIELSLTNSTIRKLAFIMAMVLVAPLLLVFLVIGQWFLPQEQTKLNDLTANIEEINRQIDELNESTQSTHFDINTAAKNIVAKNKKMLLKYSALGEVIPENLWITHTQENDKSILFAGVASSTTVVYDFYKALKKVMNDDKLILSKLQFTSDSIDKYITSVGNVPSTLYTFEIKNSKDFIVSNDLRKTFNLSEIEEKIENDGDKSNSRITTSVEPVAKSAVANDSAKASNPKAASSPAPAPAANKTAPAQSSGKEDLPPNLKKIEKF